MNKLMNVLIRREMMLWLAILVSGLGFTTRGEAQTLTLYNPFGNVHAFIVVGNTSTGYPVLVAREVSTQRCSAWQVGDANGLVGNLRIQGRTSRDDIIVVPINTTVDICGLKLTQPTYNGYHIDVAGGAGNDNLLSGSNPANSAYGESGNDILLGAALVIGSTGAGGLMDGGSGNDDIINTGYGNVLSGKAGDDKFCLGTYALLVDGGDGYDSKTGVTPGFWFNIENPNPTTLTCRPFLQ